MQTGVDAKPVVRLFKTNEAVFVLRCATEKVPAAAKYAAHQSPRRHFTADNTKSPKGSQRGAPEASNAARILLSFNRYISLGAHFPPALRGPDFPANKFRWWESRGQHGFDTRDCFGVKRGEKKKNKKRKRISGEERVHERLQLQEGFQPEDTEARREWGRETRGVFSARVVQSRYLCPASSSRVRSTTSGGDTQLG